MLLEDAIEEFLLELDIKGASKETIRSYSNSLKFFKEYMSDNTDLDNIKPIHIKGFAKFNKDRGLKQKTQNSYISSIRALYKYIRLECQKYIDRIEKYQHDDNFEYYFSLKEVNDIYGMLSMINFGSGKFTGNPFLSHLAPFQFMIIENLFCWFHKELGRNKRMIEEVILFISRKNAKSTLSALIEIIIMLRSPKMSQHAIAGKTKGISELILKDIARIIASSPKIQHLFKVNKNEIICKHNNSFCRNLSGDASSLDGMLLQSFIIDEASLLPDMALAGVLKLSQMSIENRLSIYISTANMLEHCLMYDLIDHYKKVLDGVFEDDNKTFCMIYELDAGDKYDDPTVWLKVSPLQASLPEGMEFLLSEFNKAKEIKAKMLEFRVKILNERLSSS